MRQFSLAVATTALLVAAPAFAQDAGSTPADPATAPAVDQPVSTTATAPDGSRFFGFEPYAGVMGGWDYFDNHGAYRAGVPVIRNADGSVNTHRHLNGGLVEGVVGANLPLGPVFVGIEGQASKGFDGDIDWEYGGSGRFGLRAGDSGLFYGRVGYKWVNFDRIADTRRDYHAMEYGIGVEAGPKDLGLGGLTSRAGLRLRGEVSTFGNFHAWRPMAGILAHF
ncbi:opacity protein [Sphingomonas bacterium]|uniref:opacity protein n=1 Tax=Sphingomonas bacterium TaxID=1895847 RepID=UPI001574EE57|nr:opacity protein [Sphingomonas bacterium]